MKKSNRQIYIHIANQDPEYASALRDAIENPGRYIISSYQSGEKLIDFFTKHRFKRTDIHVVFLGYHFFDENEFTLMNGIEVLESIKALNADVEVVMLYAQDEATYGAYARKSGALDFVPMNSTAFIRVNNILMRAISHKNLAIRRREFYQAVKIFVAFSVFMVLLGVALYLLPS